MILSYTYLYYLLKIVLFLLIYTIFSSKFNICLGTKVGDPVELNAISSVFCKNREEPLLVGTLKSMVGHGEPVSALNSIIKLLISFEAGYIPATIYHEKKRNTIRCLHDGTTKVVTENTKWPTNPVLAGTKRSILNHFNLVFKYHQYVFNFYTF